MMRMWVIGLVLGTGACTTTPSLNVAPPTEGAVSAYFTSYPDHFFEAATANCFGPEQTVVRPNANQVRCEFLPDPEAAAALILRYGGTVEAIPKLVIAFSGQQDSTGYLVTADSYILVPLRTGNATQLSFPDPEVQETFDQLLEQAGGRPL